MEIENKELIEFPIDEYFKVVINIENSEKFFVVLERDNEEDIEFCIHDGKDLLFPDGGIAIGNYQISKEDFVKMQNFVKTMVVKRSTTPS